MSALVDSAADGHVMALMDLQPRSVSVRALQACDAISLCTHDMLQLFDTDVEQFALMQMNLGRELCRRLRATDEHLFRATMGEVLAVPARLGDGVAWSRQRCKLRYTADSKLTKPG